MHKEAMLSIDQVSKHYAISTGWFSRDRVIRAVDRVSFDLYEGDSFGLIGESGSGKSTLGRLITALEQADAGSIKYNGLDVGSLNGNELRAYRKEVQIVFQMAVNPLDPKMTVEELMAEPLKIHRGLEGKAVDQATDELLLRVGMSPSIKDQFPHQLSGGQKQRVIIARALSTHPRLIVLDEPVSALDVSMQGQILNLLDELKHELGLTYLIITHDLYLANKFCNRLCVLKEGRVEELGSKEQVFIETKNDYTKKLLASFRVD